MNGMVFGDQKVSLDTPRIMGILNVTPDSFSDGGKFNHLDAALVHTESMLAHGATFIDVGGESTRPGASPVSVDEELTRVIPIIEAIATRFDCIISIDTSKAQVMAAAVTAGATLINDVRALRQSNALDTAAKLAREKNIAVCIMHMQGEPDTMQNAPQYTSIIDELFAFFEHQHGRLMQAGIQTEQIIIDPGFGFGKTLEHNYQLLKHLKRFTELPFPVLAGMSRKSMIAKVLEKVPNELVYGDVTTHLLAMLNGASILRVHDVAAVMDAVKIYQQLSQVE